MKVFLFLMALFLASCSQKVEIEQITETETTAPKKTISGILNGNINNLSMIGVRHEIEPGFNKVQLFEEIESLFALQNDKKVLIIDGPSPKEKYGQIFQATEPKGWLTEKTIETHNIFQLIDVRPRTAEYGQVLNSFLLEVDSLVKKGDITFSIENKNGFPVYTIEETSVHTSSVSNIENILIDQSVAEVFGTSSVKRNSGSPMLFNLPALTSS